jgi:hypothetical protein
MHTLFEEQSKLYLHVCSILNKARMGVFTWLTKCVTEEQYSHTTCKNKYPCYEFILNIENLTWKHSFKERHDIVPTLLACILRIYQHPYEIACSQIADEKWYIRLTYKKHGFDTGFQSMAEGLKMSVLKILYNYDRGLTVLKEKYNDYSDLFGDISGK